tara:strand:+ start:3722 stop:3943 length:222 start_codon:yes stop_codon:yes gene_type:complete
MQYEQNKMWKMWSNGYTFSETIQVLQWTCAKGRLMLYCDECGKSTKGKRPQFAVERDLVWICNECDEAMTWET